MKSENEVEAQCIAWLQQHGWLPIRQNVGFLWTGDETRKIRVGKVGQCDWLFLRPMTHQLGPAMLELECKAEGVILSPNRKDDKRQLEYIALRNYQGVPAAWVNSVEMLEGWYHERRLDQPWQQAA